MGVSGVSACWRGHDRELSKRWAGQTIGQSLQLESPAECKIVLFKIASAEQLEGTENHLIIKVHYIGYLHTWKHIVQQSFCTACSWNLILYLKKKRSWSIPVTS